MKSLLQTYLMGGGVVGLALSVPWALYAWGMSSFGGHLTGADRLVLLSPLACLIAVTVGVIWKRTDQKREQKPDSKVSRHE